MYLITVYGCVSINLKPFQLHVSAVNHRGVPVSILRWLRSAFVFFVCIQLHD